MMKIKVETETEIDIEDEGMDRAIIEAAAANLLSQINLTGRYGGQVPEIINAKLAEIVSAKVEQMLDTEMHQVDRFGAILPGPKKTFRDVFADTAEKFLEGRVDGSGRATTDSYSSNSRLEHLIRHVGLGSMDVECRKVAAQFKAELQARATKAITAVVAEHVKRAPAA